MTLPGAITVVRSYVVFVDRQVQRQIFLCWQNAGRWNNCWSYQKILHF